MFFFIFFSYFHFITWLYIAKRNRLEEQSFLSKVQLPAHI